MASGDIRRLIDMIRDQDGEGSGLDADLFEGKEGDYYTNASNLNSGTVPVERLSGTYNIDISGNADKVDNFDASQTPQPNVIPVTGENGKLASEFVDINLDDYRLPAPTVSTTDIYENGSGTHTITNYDSKATYEIVSHDSLITDITIENDKINITTGDITDDQDHTVSYVLRVSGIGGYLYNETTVNFTIKYLNLTSDDAIIVEDSTYIEDSFDTIYNGELAA